MKILYVDMQYDYGIKVRGLNNIGQIGFYKCFEKLGHQVECFYYDEYLKNLDQLQIDILKKAAQVKPDLIYFILFGEQFKIETLQQLKKNYRTINWFGDDQWRFEKFTSKYAPCFTYCVTTDPFSLNKYGELGIEGVFLSQWAALNVEVPEPDLNYIYDVSFIGGSNSVRRWFIDELRKNGITVATFGQGWPTGARDLTEMISIFQQSKINLNIGNSVILDIRYLMHNLKNIFVAWTNTKTSSQIKARNFEIPCYGGFQLAEYVPKIESYFDLAHEITCFSNIDEAVMLIKYHLKNPMEREALKSAGIKKAQACHTYLSRHDEIFAKL